MRELGSVLTFRPQRLAEARARVVAAHPSVAQLAAWEPSGAEELKGRVAAAAGSRDALRTLAFELTPRELVFVVRSVGAWEDLREAIAVLVAERPKDQFVLALWRAWESFPQVDLILSLLRDVSGRFGVRTLTLGPISDAVPEWLRASDTIASVVVWMDHEALKPEDLHAVSDSPFRSDTPLIGQIFEGVLIAGSEQQLLALGPSRIEEGWTVMGTDGRIAAGQHYLDVLTASTWDDALLDRTRGWYGMPGVPASIARFWKGVSEEDQRAFRRHFIAEDLAQAFRGDTERHDYWQGWGDQDEILEIHRGYAGDSEWALLSFGGFSVLEFFTIGNAAFFLPKAEVVRIDWASARKEDLKRPIPNPVTGRGDNRLIHRSTWQFRADAMMAQWLGRYKE